MAVVWGRHAVLEALRAGRPVARLLVAQGAHATGPLAEITRLAGERGIPVETVARERLDRLSPQHQGVAVEVEDFAYADPDAMLALAGERGEKPFLLLLDMVQDPQNFGSLLRTAEAVGVHGVIIPRHRAVAVTPAVIKASAGAVQYLLVGRVTNLGRTIEDLKRRGLWVIGLEANTPQAYDEVDYDLPLALVLGSEAHGASRLVREKCDLLVHLPMRGHVSSLNVAVAGSIALFHAWRTRREGGLP